jgi:hypothetical protein
MILALVCLFLLPMAAHAQSAFTGVVKDTSGAVLPGVTVEASSPALIEKIASDVIKSLSPGLAFQQGNSRGQIPKVAGNRMPEIVFHEEKQL